MSDVTCSITDACCMPCTHSQESFCCSVEPPVPRSMVSPPSGAITVCPAWSVGMGKIHGPSTIIAARWCMNCWVRSGSCPQVSTDFEAEPLLTMLTQSCRDAANPGVSTLVRLAPLLQKNGSSCHVDCSSPVASKAIPYTGGLVSALASDSSWAQVLGGERWAAANIALL